MSRIGNVYYQDDFVGIISEDENDYHFQYLNNYLNKVSSLQALLEERFSVFTTNIL